MSQENAVEKAECTPKKPKRFLNGCLWVVIVLCLVWNLGFFFVHKNPFDVMPVEGTIVILNESGESIPFQETMMRCFSHFAPSFWRNEKKRQCLHCFDNTEKIHIKLPKFPATLFFYTRDKKYGAVVEISPDKPTTGLTIELRPRYSITGRAFRAGMPLANQKISLECERIIRLTNKPVGRIAWERIHHEIGKTDADGFFTIDNIIPGAEYEFFVLGQGNIQLMMPILQPEQYREPYDLGDVSVDIR